VAAIIGVVLCVCVPVCAEEYVDVPDKVHDLNEEAVRLVVAGSLDEAISKFKESLEIQELNVTWLNLGRAYDRKGECDAARAAYDAAAQAPRAVTPPYEKFLEILYQYRSELEERCKKIEGGTQTADPTEETDTTEPPKTDVQPNVWTFSPWSFVAMGVGASMIVGGLIVDVAVIDTQFDELADAETAGDRSKWNDTRDAIDTNQTVAIALYSAGAVVLAAGTTLLVLDLMDVPSDEELASTSGAVHAPVVGVSDRDAMLGWQVQW